MSTGASGNLQIWYVDATIVLAMGTSAGLLLLGDDEVSGPIPAGVVKDLINTVVLAADGTPFTSAALCLIRLEQDGDADDGRYWDGDSWEVVAAPPASVHQEAGQHFYQLPAAATTGRNDARIAVTFTDTITEASMTTLCGTKEYLIGNVVDLLLDEPLAGHTTAGTVGLGALLNAYDDGNGPSVFFNSGSGVTGTTRGEHGTPGNPVDDEADAFTIATALGIRKYTIAGGMTLSVGHDRWTFNGCEGSTLDPGGQDINNYCIRDMIVFGAMGAGTFSGRMWDSVTFGVTGATGLFTRCGIGPGGLVLKNASSNEFDSCYTFAARKAVAIEIDFSAAVANTRISFSACSGYWRITDSTFAGNTIALHMPSGYVEFESTCTAGSAEVSGGIEVIDSSGPSFAVDDSGLVQALVPDRELSLHTTQGTVGGANVLSYYNDGRYTAVNIDTSGGVAGTVPGVNGTVDNPVDSLADAVVLAAALNIRAYKLGRFTFIALTSAHAQWVFYGNQAGVVDLGNQDCTASLFDGVNVIGTRLPAMFGGVFWDCRVAIGMTNFSGDFVRCKLDGTFTLNPQADLINVIDCYSGDPTSPPTFDYTGIAAESLNLNIQGFKGPLAFTNIVASGGTIDIGGKGSVSFDAACTGTLVPEIFGEWEVTNLGSITLDTTARVGEVVDDYLGQVGVHGAGLWDATASTAAIAAAVWAYDVTANFDITSELDTAGSAQLLGRMNIINTFQYLSGNPGSAQLYADGEVIGGTVALTWSQLDEDGFVVNKAVGSPARRGEAT